VRRRALGALAFAGAAAGSVALGYAAKRRALAGVDPEAGSEWAELHSPVRGRAVAVRSFDGTHLHAEVLGPEDAPTLVLAHGYALSQHAWHYQRRDLTDRLRLVCYDQRGHGASGEAAAGDYSMQALGRDLAAVLDATVPEGAPVVLVGHSMGGMSVLSFADQHPDRLADVAGVALVSTAGGNVIAGGAFTVGSATLAALRGSARSRLPGDGRGGGGTDPAGWQEAPPTDLAFLLTRSVGLNPAADPAHVAFTEQLMVQTPGRVKAALGPTLTSLRLAHVAERLRMPALVLVGDGDRLTPLGQARRLAAGMADARLVVLPRVGHMAPMEAHAQVTAELRALAARALVRDPAS
jgi:pimeloyl-ACP methyl ester carboxylesterase